MIVRRGVGQTTTADPGLMAGIQAYTQGTPVLSAVEAIPGALTNISAAPMFAIGLIAPAAVVLWFLTNGGKKF